MLREDVLRKKEDFNALYNKGKSFPSKHVVVLVRQNGLSFSRKAFLASKKVGGSVERNRSRRLMREAFRSLDFPVKEGFDILFIARAAILDAKCADVKTSIGAALKRAGLAGKAEK